MSEAVVRRRTWMLNACICSVSKAAAQAELLRDLHVVGGALPADQRLIGVLKGDRLRWRISSDTPGELHLHAYRLRVAVQPGQMAELAFTAHATGRFRIEWHGAAGKAAEHDAAALAVLEVRPR